MCLLQYRNSIHSTYFDIWWPQRNIWGPHRYSFNLRISVCSWGFLGLWVLMTLFFICWLLRHLIVEFWSHHEKLLVFMSRIIFRFYCRLLFKCVLFSSFDHHFLLSLDLQQQIWVQLWIIHLLNRLLLTFKSQYFSFWQLQTLNSCALEFVEQSFRRSQTFLLVLIQNERHFVLDLFSCSIALSALLVFHLSTNFLLCIFDRSFRIDITLVTCWALSSLTMRIFLRSCSELFEIYFARFQIQLLDIDTFDIE